MKTYMRFIAVLLLCLTSSTALADIVMPESLHRIGYEVLVYATGAAAALGGGLLARNRKRKVLASAKPIAEWKTEDCVTAEERNDIEAKLNAGIPFIKDVFDQRYEELLPKWLAEDKKLPKRYTFPYHVGRNRMFEWKSKNEALLKEILAADGELVQRFTGVPLEYLRDRLMNPMPDDFTGGWFAGDPFLEIRRKLEMRRKIVRTLIHALTLVAVGIGEYSLWRYPFFRMLLCGNLTCVILSVGGLSLSFCFSEFDVHFTRLTGKNNAQLSDRELKWKVWRQFAVSKLTWGIVVFLALIVVCARADIDRWHWMAVAFLWVKILSANLLWVMSGIVVSILFARVREFGVKFVKRRHSRQQHVEERAEQMPQPDPTTAQRDSFEDTVPFVCDGAHKQPPIVVGEQGGIVLGRSHRSDVRLYVYGPADVSGRHVEIVREGSQFIAVCLSIAGMTVNDVRIKRSGRRPLHEGDCMRIGKDTEVLVVRLPKDGDDVMVLNVTDSHGTREETVRLPMVAEDTPREEECLSRPCHDNAGLRDGDTVVCCDDGFPAADGGGMMCTKPVIYLYPQSPIKCSVCVRFNGKLTCTYPAHGTEGWCDFVAAPDGTLTFPDGRQYYCLYWEGTTPTRWDFSKGYCVKGEDTAVFLADVLAKMGLSFREANEFIVYWLPRMQGNPYNVIAFQGERYAESAKLEISPSPDSVLRVFMAWKASDCPVDIPTPDIKPFERKGFTVVEWGGAESCRCPLVLERCYDSRTATLTPVPIPDDAITVITVDPSEYLDLRSVETIHGFRLSPSSLMVQGGQGRLFKAECVEEGRLGLRKGTVVALKFVEETDASPSFEEFEKAVAYLREIKSPHIPRYHGCFKVERQVNGRPKHFRMTVMEYLDGADLGYRVRVRSPNFYADEIMYVLDQLLEGLGELSAAGIVHRDIKPSNVFICRDGTVKLIDFDTALIRGIDLSPKNRKIAGTPEFAAPDYLAEGFRGDEISDVFSVGMTLYYMVHGASPHRARGMLSGRMDENAFRAVWGKHQEESGDRAWWKWDEKKGGGWLSGGMRAYVPLLGLPKVFGKAIAEDRDWRFTSFEDFRRSLSMIEFVRARYGKKGYLRVVSNLECESGAGAGYWCVDGRDDKGELHGWGMSGLVLVHPEQMKKNERSALLKIFYRWWDVGDPSLWFGGSHEGCVDIRDLCSSCSRTPLVVTEKFAAENVSVVQSSFNRIKSPEEWQREVEDYEFQMQLS